jgi:hypothetical protein
VLTLGETIEFLRQCHKRAPFLFFNGNTFADMGRQILGVVFAELPTTRRRQVMSAAAHYIAGVLGWEAMIEIIESLSKTAELEPGARVKTLRGSLQGRVVRLLEDGRVVWRPEGSSGELISLPEGLLLDAEEG